MKPLEIGETATLENGDVVKCVNAPEGITLTKECELCYFGVTCQINAYDNPRFTCIGPGRVIHFELVKNISPDSENIEKKE